MPTEARGENLRIGGEVNFTQWCAEWQMVYQPMSLFGITTRRKERKSSNTHVSCYGLSTMIQMLMESG